MKLSTTLQIFNDNIHSLTIEGNNLYKTYTLNLKQLNESRISWTKKAYEYLNGSLGCDNQGFCLEFITLSHASNLEGCNKTFEDLKMHIVKQLQCLLYISDLVSVSDTIIDPNNPELAKRKNFAISQKEEFILKKLYPLYPKGKYYSINKLFEHNAIPINCSDDDAKICGPMVKLGDIEIEYSSNGVMARLTETGVKIVETKFLHLKNTNNRSFINSEKKFDAIIDELNQTNIIQDVVFEEINELRQLIHKLSPKIWKEVVIGKMVNLGMQDSAKNTTLKYIYERLTNDKKLFNE